MYYVRVVHRSAKNATSNYSFNRRGEAVDFIRNMDGFNVKKGNTIQKLRDGRQLYIVGMK